MKLFYQNGGGPCYIVSVGNYEQKIEAPGLTTAIKLLVKEQEPTMVLIPEAILLEEANCISVQQAALQHCGDKMKTESPSWISTRDTETGRTLPQILKKGK